MNYSPSGDDKTIWTSPASANTNHN